MNKIYHLKTCSTCQRIIKELGAEGIDFQEIKTQPISEAQLDALAKTVGSYQALFNTRAQKIKLMGLDVKNLTEAECRKLILEEYTFLKRPVIVVGNNVFVGNSPATVSAVNEALKA
jgi:arsenate reductase (glutaredoxin)